LLKCTKFKFRAHGFNTKPGWVMNEECRVKIVENFYVKNARRELTEHLDYVQKHKRCNGLRNFHREKNHNIHGVEP
jgi:hypothetical protein